MKLLSALLARQLRRLTASTCDTPDKRAAGKKPCFSQRVWQYAASDAVPGRHFKYGAEDDKDIPRTGARFYASHAGNGRICPDLSEGSASAVFANLLSAMTYQTSLLDICEPFATAPAGRTSLAGIPCASTAKSALEPSPLLCGPYVARGHALLRRALVACDACADPEPFNIFPDMLFSGGLSRAPRPHQRQKRRWVFFRSP